MISTLAWRNIWRNRTRSLVILGAVMIGVWALIFLLSFMFGMVRSYINNTIESQISHLQIHETKYMDDKEVQYFFQDYEDRLASIKKMPTVQAAAARTIVTGMIASAKTTGAAFVHGINPEDEAALTKMNERVIEGDYLSDDKKNPILISERMAKELQVGLRKKVVLRFQDVHGEIVANSYRVVGIYKTGKNQFDDVHVFVRQKDLNKLLNIENGAHEIAVFLKNEDHLLDDSTAIQKLFPNQLVQTYEQIAPDVKLFKTQIWVSSSFIIGIMMFALMFGIINTMLMAVLERYRELGMLMAVGMNKGKVYGMIMLETLMLGAISAPLGMLLGWLTVNLTRRNGIDLSAWSDGLGEFGMSSLVYPSIEPVLYWQVAIAVLITSIIGALYPAYKAIKLKPVEAIQKI